MKSKDDLKPCHEYHLNKCKRNNCKFSHEGSPQGKCIIGLNCFLCKDKEERKSSTISAISSIKQCHDYHLKGSCEFQNCRFSHEGVPQLKCILGEGCKFCILKKKKIVSDNRCHHYHLNQCTKVDCKFSHQGVPENKCIYEGEQQDSKCPWCSKKMKEEERKSSISSAISSIKLCHNYHLKGSCELKNCRFNHEGVPQLKCILGEGCSFCVLKKKNIVADNRCHYYHLNQCTKVDCKFSHQGVPENKCIYQGEQQDSKCPFCQRKILKECHAYHLNKCTNTNCPRKHNGPPQNKCIYGILCFKCNNACHQFQVKGKCTRYKCKFDHIQPPSMKCPFGTDNCIFCNFRRVKRKKCHFQQKYGKCDIKNCKFQHKNVDYTKECTNFWCKVCMQENGQFNNQITQKIQDQVQKITQQIDEPEVNLDSLKAAEQVEDDKLMCILPPLIPEEAISNNNRHSSDNQFSFFPYKYNLKNPTDILTACRQILKRFLGFNYVITNDIVQIFAKGQGKIISSNGEQIQVDIENNKLTLENKQQLISDQIYAVKVVVRQDTYYQKINSLKQKNKQEARLEEQTMFVALQPLNSPIIGQFLFKQDQNKQQKQQYQYEPQKDNSFQHIILNNIQRLQSLSKQTIPKQLQLNKCTLEVAFVLDTTGSMQPYIDESKNTIIQIIKEIERKVPKTRFQIKYGVVAYRDHPPQDDTYVTKFQDFSFVMQESIAYIQNLEAKGGGDSPEAVFDGLFQAGELSWSQDDQSYGGCQRIVIHITDAPPHGKQYSRCDSQWEDGCPCKIDVKKISELFNQQEISYNMLAIGESLEKTIKIFSRYFQQFDYRDIKYSEYSKQTSLILQMLEKFPWWQLASE